MPFSKLKIAAFSAIFLHIFQFCCTFAAKLYIQYYIYCQTKDINTNDSQYKNKEEKRVIEGSEQNTAQKLGKLNEGEVTRSTHKGGKIYETISPVSDEKLSVSF